MSAAQPHSALQKHSCSLCQQRKVKCDRRGPCANCTKAQAECIFREPAPVRRRKRKAPETDPYAALARYEMILNRLGVNLDTFDGDDTPSKAPEESVQPAHAAAMKEAGRAERANGTGFVNTGRLIIREGRSRYLEKYAATCLAFQESVG